MAMFKTLKHSENSILLLKNDKSFIIRNKYEIV